jgi:DNA invertase Pin-like site-specific DNA recombinase
VRAALYARTSTGDGSQHLDNQLVKLREFAGRMSWEISAEYTDQESGAKPDRPGLNRLMHNAARRGFDVVLVYDLSRLTREGAARAFELITRLKRSRVEFWSLNEEHFRTSGPAGEILIAIAAYLAKSERDGIRHRILAGIARARREGRHIGRPKEFEIDSREIKEMKKTGLSIRAIAAKKSCSKSTIERILREA